MCIVNKKYTDLYLQQSCNTICKRCNANSCQTTCTCINFRSDNTILLQMVFSLNGHSSRSYQGGVDIANVCQWSSSVCYDNLSPENKLAFWPCNIISIGMPFNVSTILCYNDKIIVRYALDLTSCVIFILK